MELRKAKSAAVSSMPIMYAWNVCIWLDDDYDSDFGFYCSGETEKCGSSAWITTKPSFRMRANHWLTVMYGDLDQCWNPIKRVGKPERELALRNPNQFPQLAIVSRSCPSTEKKASYEGENERKTYCWPFSWFYVLENEYTIEACSDYDHPFLWLVLSAARIRRFFFFRERLRATFLGRGSAYPFFFLDRRRALPASNRTGFWVTKLTVNNRPTRTVINARLCNH